MRMIFSNYDALDVNGTKRNQIEEEVKTELEKIFRPKGIIVEEVLLSEIVPKLD